jgi:hypothetical protein
VPRQELTPCFERMQMIGTPEHARHFTDDHSGAVSARRADQIFEHRGRQLRPIQRLDQNRNERKMVSPALGRNPVDGGVGTRSAIGECGRRAEQQGSYEIQIREGVGSRQDEMFKYVRDTEILVRWGAQTRSDKTFLVPTGNHQDICARHYMPE